MLQVTYSERTETLLESLIERLAAERAGPLDPVFLVVPSHSLTTYLKLGIARRSGIAANIQSATLPRFFSQIAEESAPDLQIVDRALLEGTLLGIFLDPAQIEREELAPVRRYLFAAGENDEAVDVRRHQLARELAMLFEAYVASRGEMIDRWRERTTIEDPLYAEIERWQRTLFLEICGKGGILDRRDRSWVFLARLFDRLPLSKAKLPPSIHLFGYSHLPPAYYRLLETAAKKASISIYALNPTRHFWEDVNKQSREASPALARWGRGGREHVRALNALTEQPIERWSEEQPEPATLLEQVQRDVLEYATEPRISDRWSSDESIRILACPGVRREVEVVAQEIWRLVRESDPPLRFNEIAVLVNETPEQPYGPHLEAVFRECDEIPYNVIDRPLSAETRVVEAIELLLALPLSNFRRQDLLAVITHPAVLSRWGEIDRHEWLTWCEQLSIVHGADRSDHAGTYINKDLYNWDQGLRRLALGVFIGSSGADEVPLYELGAEKYVPEEIRGERAESAAKLSLLVRSLIADARFAKNERLSLSEWITYLELFLTSYLGATSEQDERALRRCLKAIADLSKLELGDVKLGYRLMHELARSAIAPLTGGRGQHLADGVVVAPFLPMRALPFKVIFVLGLGSGRFPAGDRKNQLDLRWAERRPSDLTPEERDRWLFLETLLSARERLYLSYESRNAITGEDFEPSAAIIELLDVLGQNYLGTTRAWSTLVRREHLRRFNPEYFPDDTPIRDHSLRGARLEAEARRLGDHLRDHLGRGLDLRADLPKIRRTYGGELAARLGLVSLPRGDVTARDEEGPLRISITTLRRFLECPLQGSARFLLNMRDEEDLDLVERNDEVFKTRSGDRARAMRWVFFRAMRGATDFRDESLRALYRERVERLERRGLKPTGLFGQVEDEWDQNVFQHWNRHLRRWLGHAAATPLAPIVFGRADDELEPVETRDPIRFELDYVGRSGKLIKRPVEIHGKTEALLFDPSASLIMLIYDVKDNEQSRRAAKKRFDRDSLRAFLDHVVLSAAGRNNGPHWSFVGVAGDQTQPEPYEREFPALSPEEARSYLQSLVRELVGSVHAYLLPFEAVLELREGQKSAQAVVEHVRNDLIEGRGQYITRWGPVPRPERYVTPSEEDARRILLERYGHFFGLTK